MGYRFGRAAYLTDFRRLAEESAALLDGLDDLILDALRDVPHPMHMTVEQSLALIDKLKPKRAWFTHIAHELGHAATNERLRKAGYPQVQLAYDGLTFEVEMEARAGVVGDNFRFGHKQAGDVKFLRELGMRDGFDVIVHEPVVVDGKIVSSTMVRKLIAEGDVARAARMLGRAFALTGEVAAGT